MDRFHLAIGAIERAGCLHALGGDIIDIFKHQLTCHAAYIREHDEDMPEVVNWKWSQPERKRRAA